MEEVMMATPRGGRGAGWMLATALLALAGPALAGPAMASDGAPRTRPGGEFCARVDVGRAPGQHGFRITVAGGEPGAWALLLLRTEEGRRASQMVLLDEHGAGSVTLLDRHMDRPCVARFLLANKGKGGGKSTNPVTLPTSGVVPGPATVMERGDVIINEFLKDPKSVSDSSGEWIELWNATSRVVNIEGWWILDDGGDRHMLYNKAQGLYLQPGQYFVLGRKADPAVNGGVVVDYQYSGFSLANGEDEIRLVSRGEVLMDEVRYDDGVFWPDEPGKSISLDPRKRGPQFNDDPGNWCHARTAISTTNPDLGTPGARNDLCP